MNSTEEKVDSEGVLVIGGAQNLVALFLECSQYIFKMLILCFFITKIWFFELRGVR